MSPRSVLTALIALLLGCAAPLTAPPADPPTSRPTTAATQAVTKPTTTQAATTQSRRPVPETFTVDLAADYGPFKPLAKGLHRLTPTVRPTAQLMQALAPLLDEPTPTLITLGSTVKFDG